MKVVHICTNYKGGAGKAAFRMHNALLAANIDSVFMSFGEKPLTDINGNHTILLNPHHTLWTRLVSKIRKKSGWYHPFEKQLRSLRHELEYTMVSLPVKGISLNHIKEIKEADIIHLHAVQNLIDYGRFFKNLKKPLAWTLHDINPIAGMFHLRTDEAHNRLKAGILDEEVRRYKSGILRDLQNAAIVAPSQWLCDEVEKRNVFGSISLYEIPNAVPEIYFRRQDRTRLKQQYKLNQSHTHILYVVSDFADKNKGLDLLINALQSIDTSDICLLLVGSGDRAVFETFRFFDFGYINDDEEMANIYNLADIFVLPSRDENLPNVLLESLACGTPVVSFPVGGMQQYIKNGINGETAEEISGSALAKALTKAVQNIHLFQREAIKRQAHVNFNTEKHAESYINVYKKLQENHHRNP
ncbi:glycosyltransferase [Flavobacterium pallidum]|uniref:Glycosyl transferase family 1 n=1 Tax=Flavobacterium pallidum TaxID=2172098 RepID=A0A2S1SGW2_9FLAO|nr:glycosyltransferase [Flavobacterium pallidum]AWI25656.1 hypothetical protein HYN49_06955 [Flavobacterium pallidum]